jgi:hypothetical protein
MELVKMWLKDFIFVLDIDLITKSVSFFSNQSSGKFKKIINQLRL